MTRGNGALRFGPVVVLPDGLLEKVQQGADPLPRFSRNGNGRFSGLGHPERIRDKILFIPDGNGIDVFRHGLTHPADILIGYGGSIKDPEDDFRSGQRIAAALDPHTFYDIRGMFANSRRINEIDRHTADGGRLPQSIACGSGNGGHNGAVISQKRIQQTRFSHIRRTGDHQFDAIPENRSRTLRGKQLPELPAYSGELTDQLFRGLPVQIFLGEVQTGFNLRQQMIQFSGAGTDFVSERTGKLAFGNPSGGFRAGGDQVGDRFRLSQVHFSIEEGAPCEFSRFRESGSRAEDLSEHPFRSVFPAVALNFNNILARITCGTRHVDRHAGLAAGAIRVESKSERESAGRFRGKRMTGSPDSGRNCQSTGSGNADDCQGTPRSGAKCGNRVVLSHIFSNSA